MIDFSFHLAHGSERVDAVISYSILNFILYTMSPFREQNRYNVSYDIKPRLWLIVIEVHLPLSSNRCCCLKMYLVSVLERFIGCFEKYAYKSINIRQLNLQFASIFRNIKLRQLKLTLSYPKCGVLKMSKCLS